MTRRAGAMLLGAYFAGLAIEQSMLGAAHACANPLTARYGTTHGIAVVADAAARRPLECRGRSMPLTASCSAADTRSERRSRASGSRRGSSRWRGTCGFPPTLADAGVAEADLPELAAEAAQQWTGTFNPRPLTAAAALELYRRAFR